MGEQCVAILATSWQWAIQKLEAERVEHTETGGHITGTLPDGRPFRVVTRPQQLMGMEISGVLDWTYANSMRDVRANIALRREADRRLKVTHRAG